jgi:hypothetical protein
MVTLHPRDAANFDSRAAAGATPSLSGHPGLLDGMADPDKADFYATSMDLKRAAQLVSDRGIIYQAAKRDAEELNKRVKDYLEDVTGGEFRTATRSHFVR